MKKLIITLFFVFAIISIQAQNQTQTIRGTINDKQSQTSMPGVSVLILGTDPIKGTLTDVDGHFKLEGIAPGRYDLKISYTGYKEQVLSNIDVTAGKEVVLDIV